MGNVDLDAARRARFEAQSAEGAGRHTLTVNGETIELPVELPYEFAEHLVTRDFRAALTSVIGKEKAGEVFGSGLSIPDIYEFCDQVAKLYSGAERGES